MASKIKIKRTECLHCANEFPKTALYYYWNFMEPKGLCKGCHNELKDKGMNEIEILLETKYKGWNEKHNFHFKTWNYMWSKEVYKNFWKRPHYTLNDKEEPEINFALTLAWEMRLYFRNVIVDVQNCLKKFENKTDKTYLKIMNIIDAEIEKYDDKEYDSYWNGYNDALSNIRHFIIEEVVK